MFLLTASLAVSRAEQQPERSGAAAAAVGARSPGGSAAPACAQGARRGRGRSAGSRPGREGLRCCCCWRLFRAAASRAGAGRRGMQPYRGRAGAAPSPARSGGHKDEPTGHVRPVQLPMQHNLNYYPQIFWVDGCADAGAPCPQAPPGAPFPPPVPDRRRKPRNHSERSSAGFLVMFLLILVAFTGVGLSIFKIFHLEKEVDELREVRCAWLLTAPWGNGAKEPPGIGTEMLPKGNEVAFQRLLGQRKGVLVPVRDCGVGG